MAEVPQSPPEGKGGDASAALDFTDPVALRAWLAALRTQIDDIHAAGEDATRTGARRTLGRATARATIQEAHRALQQLMAFAEQGLRA